jgi:AcrR family transcriptional regulator
MLGYVEPVTSAVAPRFVPRGRPRIFTDEAILDAALEAFAVHGFDGMSIRALNKELGLSHATVNQRFGTKDALYTAAIDHGFRSLLLDLNDEIAQFGTPADPLEEIRLRFRAFLVASSRRPQIGRLMNNEGLIGSARLDLIHRRYIEPTMRVTTDLMERLVAEGRIRSVSERLVFFMLVQGGSMPFTMSGLASKFDRVDGPVEPDLVADEVADFLVRGMLVAQN